MLRAAICLGFTWAQPFPTASSTGTPCDLIPTACSDDVRTCGPRRVTNTWTNMETLVNCEHPLEIRVGLTVSITGSLSFPETTNDILSTLTEIQAMQGDYLNFIKYCLAFCVVDDESSAMKAGKAYRTFADKASSYSVDLMLGPSSSHFRAVAVQVAQEFDWPLLLWSVSSQLGRNPVQSGQGSVQTTLSWVSSLLTASLPTSEGFNPVATGRNCGSYRPPAGYVLRPRAHLLLCDGVCRDLEHCAIPEQDLLVTPLGPPSPTRTPAWQNGCLETNETLDVQLWFPEPSVPVTIEFSNGVLWMDFYARRQSPLIKTLRSGTALYFQPQGEDMDEAYFKICMRQSCNLACPAPLRRAPAGTHCQGVTCTAADLATCCTAHRALWPTRHPVLDMGVPPTEWLLDALPRLFQSTRRAQLLVCLPEIGDTYTRLCERHLQGAIDAGFRTTFMPSINAGVGLQYAIVKLQLMRPPPGVILVCSEMPLYSRFIHGLASSQLTFPWVISCFPFGRDLQASNRGTMLTYNFVEAFPWPSLASSVAQEKDVTDALLLNGGVAFKNLSSLVAEMPGISIQMLKLRSAVQILFRAVRNALSSFVTAVDLNLIDLLPQVVGQVTRMADGVPFLRSALLGGMQGQEFSFPTYFGFMHFDALGRRQLKSRFEMGTRVFVPLEPIQTLSQADNVSIPQSWEYQQARHYFGSFREYSGQTPLLALSLQALANKMELTYPCPPGCEERELQCWACAPGFARQANGRICTPCPENVSVFQDRYAGAQCFRCPPGAICDRTNEPPVAAPGYVRLVDPSYPKGVQIFNGPMACSTGANGGLGMLHAEDLSRWDAAKAKPRWWIKPCNPPEACLGNNQCGDFSTGRTCSGCLAGSSKFEWWFARWDCAECVTQPVLPCLMMALIQVLMVLMIVLANQSSSWSEHSLAAPALLAFVRIVRKHAFLSDLLVEPVSSKDLSVWMWVATSSQVLFAPCFLPLFSCSTALTDDASFNLHLLIIFASGLSVILVSSLLTLCFWRRMDVVIGSIYAGLQLELPSMAFNVLRLATCVEDDEGYFLLLFRDNPCPANGVSITMATFCVLVMVLQWMAIPWVLRDVNYVQTLERFGIAFQKLLPGRRYWKVVDDLCATTPSILAVYLGRDAAAFNFLTFEGLYTFLVVNIRPHSMLQNNGIARMKVSLGVNILTTCTAILFSDFVLAYLEEVAAGTQREPRLVFSLLVLGTSLAHILYITVAMLFENRIALVVNTQALSGPPSKWTLRLKRFVQCFASSQSLKILKNDTGTRSTFDASTVPVRFRGMFMNGVTAALSYILSKNLVLRMADVRNMVAKAVDKVAEARRVHTMRRLNVVAGQKSFSEETDNDFLAFLESDLIASFELVSTVEDMCDGNLEVQGRVEKRPQRDEEEDEVVDKKEENSKVSAAVFLKRQQAKERYDQKLYKRGQADCLETILRLLPEAEHMQRRLSSMWMSSRDDSGRLIPLWMNKVQKLHDLLKEANEHLEKSDQDFAEKEEFLTGLVAKLAVLVPKAEAESELDTGLTEAECREILGEPDVEPEEKRASKEKVKAPRSRARLSFSRLDFRSNNQPFSSRSALTRTFDE